MNHKEINGCKRFSLSVFIFNSLELIPVITGTKRLYNFKGKIPACKGQMNVEDNYQMA